MNGKEFARALRSGQRVYGTAVVSTSPRWPQVIAGAGLDFVFLDTEHLPIGREMLAWMCQIYRSMGLAPLVRILAPDPYLATAALDAGACAIVAPYVETVEQAKALRGAVKLRPLKGQRLQRILEGEAVEPTLDGYLKTFNENHVLVLNIESVPAMEALDDILDVPDLDAVLIGPHDLSCNMGLPELYQHPEVREAIGTIFSKARAKNIGAGIHYTGSADDQVALVQLGANMIIHGSDIALVDTHLKADIRAIKQTVGDADTSAAGPSADTI